MQRQVDRRDIRRHGLGDRVQELARQPVEPLTRQGPGAAGRGAIDRHQFEIRPRAEHVEKAADAGIGISMGVEQRLAAQDCEIRILAGQRIERRDFLLAFRNENLAHQGHPQQVLMLSNNLTYAHVGIVNSLARPHLRH